VNFAPQVYNVETDILSSSIVNCFFFFFFLPEKIKGMGLFIDLFVKIENLETLLVFGSCRRNLVVNVRSYLIKETGFLRLE
jgi:hypothetical protein